MENKNNVLVVIIVILAILVGGLGSFIIYDKVLSKDTKAESTTTENNVEGNTTVEDNNISKENDYLGTYTLKVKDNAPEGKKGEAPSSLKLNDDNTFEFVANMCTGMLTIKGEYSIDNNSIILKNLKAHEDYQSMVDLNLRGKDTLEFAIVSKNEIYLVNENFGCVLSGNEYGSFVK